MMLISTKTSYLTMFENKYLQNGTKSEYTTPLTRYSSSEMNSIFSDDNKYILWRKLWIALAKAQSELNLPITQEQINEMESQIYNIDYKFAEEKEKEINHDVMSHIHAFGKICPTAMPIIHLGATSCFITDNCELIQMHHALGIILSKLFKLVYQLQIFANENKNLPTLGFTHFQPAQLTTVGKRTCMWLQDYIMDIHDIKSLIDNLPLRGVKGTTGTQASFLELFDGDHEKVKQLDTKVISSFGFSHSIPISGQTYTRKWDYKIVSALSGIAQSAHKMATDIRLLANLKEMEEPFDPKQVGSSAMAYKRNPMRCERICSLSRYVMSLPANCAQTHSTQWFERTLDDSANRRIVLSESFLATDGLLNTIIDVTNGLQIWPMVINKHINEELPFMATELILMKCVKAGGANADRQKLHEKIREHSLEAGKRVKIEGKENDLLERIMNDPDFSAVHDELPSLNNPINFIGRSPQQVDDYLTDIIKPLFDDLDNQKYIKI